MDESSLFIVIGVAKWRHPAHASMTHQFLQKKFLPNDVKVIERPTHILLIFQTTLQATYIFLTNDPKLLYSYVFKDADYEYKLCMHNSHLISENFMSIVQL